MGDVLKKFKPGKIGIPDQPKLVKFKAGKIKIPDEPKLKKL